MIVLVLPVIFTNLGNFVKGLKKKWNVKDKVQKRSIIRSVIHKIVLILIHKEMKIILNMMNMNR